MVFTSSVDRYDELRREWIAEHAGIFSMLALQFSWAINSTAPVKALLLPTWSPCVCVLMTIITGLGVTDLIFSKMPGPLFGSFVSTTTTPFSVMKAAVLPPPPLIT